MAIATASTPARRNDARRAASRAAAMSGPLFAASHLELALRDDEALDAST